MGWNERMIRCECQRAIGSGAILFARKSTLPSRAQGISWFDRRVYNYGPVSVISWRDLDHVRMEFRRDPDTTGPVLGSMYIS